MSFFDLNSYMCDMVYEYVPGVKRVGSNKLNFRCPLCGDGKKKTSHRGWFYIDSGSYFCWNAGCVASETGMSGLRFLSMISGKSIIDIKTELIKRAGSFSSVLSKPEIKNLNFSLFDDNLNENSKIEKYILDKIDLGDWTEKLPKFVSNYLEKRKINKASFLPLNYQFYYDKKLKRLVIPWGNEYYQERTIFKSQSKEDKYLFPSNSEKPIFGLNNIDSKFKYIFLVEGVFDSIWVKNGVAVGSLTLSNHQKDLLKPFENDYTIVYLMDNQYSDKSSLDKTLKICEKNPYANIFIWPKALHMFKDINDTIVFHDKFIDVWKDENYLKKYIFNGIRAKLELR
jgi:hypothetical protein